MSLSPAFAALVRDATANPGPQIQIDTRLKLAQVIRQGLPVSAVDYLVRIGKLTSAEVDKVVIPRKTLAHRRDLGTLTSDQSDRFVRVARIITLAEETFANEEKAAKWLRRPTTALTHETPLSLLDTEQGAREVEALLTRIAHGIAA